MRKLYIVEDEKMIRKGLRAIAERSGVLIESISEFANGQDAYEACCEQMPDLMITDIRMPKLDGIGLVNKLKEINRLPRTIVISGYDDFEYARNMLRCGAKDYILKPVEREKVTELLVQMEADIKEEQNGDSHIRELVIMQLQQVISGGEQAATMADAEQIAATLFEKDFDNKEVVICCDVQLSGQNKPLWHFRSRDGNYYYLIQKEQERENGFAGYSKPFTKIQEIYGACAEAKSERLSRFYNYDYNDGNVSEKEQPDEEKELAIIITNVRKLGSERAQESLTYIKDCYGMYLKRKITPMQWFVRMTTFCKELKQFYPDMIGEGGDQLLLPYCFEDAESYYKQVCITMEEIIQYVADNSEDYKNRIKIAEAVSYIKNNFATDLNMAVVSNQIGMSYSWFSAIFKQYTGCNFVSYLKNVRMEEAKRLLEQTELKIQEVSAASGYENEVHFMKSFKNEFGISPSDYRKSMKLQKEIREI